jgi:putative heme-binding domain-containing protein
MTRAACLLCLLLATGIVMPGVARSDDEPPSAVGPVMRLLKSGHVPESRIEQFLTQVASRGNEHDLAYLYKQAVVEKAYDDELQTRLLELLAEAASDRGVTPAGDLSGIASLIRSAPPQSEIQQLAIQLAGLWKVPGAAESLAAILTNAEAPAARRDAALQAIRRLGGETARKVILPLTAPDQPLPLRLQGAAALVGVDLQTAAVRTATILQDADAETDLQEVVSAFLDRQGGSDVLASAIEANPPSADVAKRALRAMYAVGRSDAKLSVVLGKIAGIDSDPQPLTKEEVLAMVPVVEAEGDAVRGEEVFRRADLSCLKCHAVSKAGGQVGPDLSAVGASSPIDYLLHSISDPDQQIKEAYITRVVVTDEGQVLQGVVANRTDDTLVLRDAAGNLVSIPNDSIEEEIEGKSLMPKGLMKFMTEEELLDLVKFLSMLGKPGTEYAIRSTPRMQRWRVLSDVPEEFLEQVPDFTAFEDHIYRAGDGLPVYARVGGDVPLEEVTTRLQQPVVYLVGEVEVTQPGSIGVRLDSAEGVTMWVDKHLAQDAEAIVELPPGRHPITLRIDTQQRKSDTLKLDLFRPAGSKAEFTVVDGA